ncbi:alpha/beta fold hydrolase [Litoribacter ruber]|uniref:alpha/beta hydrolase n=1 Tax=Litoribacter ruber TaxID=702568 RepID=UPI001BD96D88|nr:alpha/beta fold hydrolase [Litoribacter ruber]MBT0810796.1 alpha/beta fold hydrolase [Litoribacter ruber]
MLRKILIVLLVLAVIMAIGYVSGPRQRISPLTGDYPEVPIDPLELDAYLQLREDTVKGLKEDNEAKIIWADSSTKHKTEYAFVYIHGFGASEKEGHPLHRELAQYFGANLFLTRLPEHGIDRNDAFRHLSAQQLADAAREAYSIGKAIGDKVVVIGTSMGGALTLMLGSEQEDIEALVLLSPAIRDFEGRLELLFQPWMTNLLASAITNEEGVQIIERSGDKAQYWSEQYHVNAYTSLAVLLKSKMNTDTFEQIKQPVFMGYYYKDDENQDFVVSVPAMLDMFEELGTDEKLKVKMAFPEANDHVIGSAITSEDWQSVLEACKEFLSQRVGIPVPIEEVEYAK